MPAVENVNDVKKVQEISVLTDSLVTKCLRNLTKVKLSKKEKSQPKMESCISL